MPTHRPPASEREATRQELPPLRGTAADGEPPRPTRRWPRLVAMSLGALVFGFLSGFALRSSGPQISTTGPAPDAHLGPAATDDLTFRIASDLPSLMDTATLEYDGGDVREQAFVSDGVLTYRPRDLSEGTHTLDFSVDQPFVPWPVRRSWTFTVDHTRPEIEITGPNRPAVRGAPVTLTGRVSEPSRVTVDDAPVDVADDGTFSITFPDPPAGAIAVRATDLAGNSRGVRTSIPLVTREPIQGVRAVHMTAISWNTDYLREPVLKMLRDGEINTIELDLKDEYRLKDAVAQIRALGGRVMGRIVAFRDPVLAKWAWANGHREQVIQAPDGTPYSGYGGFTNFSNPVVRRYNIDIAREAAEAGVEDILYDYIRRPDGPLETMVFPGLRGGAQKSIVSFLASARQALEPTGAFLGASLFGIAAFRPQDVAQDVHRIARNVDYIAPLIYPSHWGRGIFGIDDPESEPRQVIRESIIRFNDLVAGTGARVVPWLQDFSLRVHYGPGQVCAQLAGARDEGVTEWIMWDANVTYTRADCLKG
jgi:hypothetical protein